MVRRAGIAVLTAAAAAVAYTIACPPYGWSVIAWLIPALLLVPSVRLGPACAALCGVAFSLLMGAGVMGWAVHASLEYFDLNQTRSAAFAVLVWLTYGGIPFGVLLALYAWAAPRVPCAARAPLAAWMWTGMEMLRTHLFTGMPWELLGHTQFRQLWLVQIADLGGVYAVSFVMTLVSVAVAELAVDARAGGLRVSVGVRRLAPAAGLVIATVAYGAYARGRYTQPDRQPAIAVAAVQGNVANAFRWKRAYFERTLAVYAGLTERTRADAPDLVVWPENAVDFYLDREPMLRQQLSRVAALAPAGLLVGSPRLAAPGEARNSVQLLAADGTIRDVYDKQHLVPFAEYNPLRQPTPDPQDPVYRPGGPAEPVVTTVGRLGTTICYEVLFPDLVRDLVRRGAQVLVNVSNDSWLDAGNGAALEQHFSMAVFRAIETRRDLVRVAGSGASGFIDPIGRVVATVPRNTAGAVVGRVRLRDDLTPYVRWGDAWIFLFGAVIALDVFRHRVPEVVA
jgi:apolipoprotein N-acyltransferase